MILDAQALFCTNQNAFGAADTNVVMPDQMDLLQNRDLGHGEPLYGNVHVTQNFVGPGASVTFEFVTAANAALTSNVEVIGSTGAVDASFLTAGAVLTVRISPTRSANGRRYVGLRARSTAAATTAGRITGYISQSAANGHIKVYPAQQAFV